MAGAEVLDETPTRTGNVVTVHNVDTGMTWTQEVSAQPSLGKQLGASAVSTGAGWGDGGWAPRDKTVFISHLHTPAELASPQRAMEYARGVHRGDQRLELKPRAGFDPFLFAVKL